jgi:hypothetical protein
MKQLLYGILILAVAVFLFYTQEGFGLINAGAPDAWGGIGSKFSKIRASQPPPPPPPSTFISPALQNSFANTWGAGSAPALVVRAIPRAPAPIPAGCSAGVEGGVAYPTCPNGQLITGGTIRYGKWDGTDTPREKTVPIPDSCKGRNNCGVSVNNQSMGGDPYPNVFKQFLACPTCSAPPRAAPAPSMVSSAYAASCTKCTLVNNQLSCSCDVTPR